MYNFSSNESHIVNYGPGKPVYEGSELAEMLPKGLNGYVQRVVEVWNQGNSDAGFALKLKSETNTDKAQAKAALDS